MQHPNETQIRAAYAAILAALEVVRQTSASIEATADDIEDPNQPWSDDEPSALREAVGNLDGAEDSILEAEGNLATQYEWLLHATKESDQ